MFINPAEISSALSLTKTIVEFGLSLQGASADARATRERIESVQSDLNALRLLRSDSRLQLNRNLSWTKTCDDVIQEGDKAIFNCAKPVEGCRVDDMLHGTVTVYRRIMWVMRDVGTVKLHEPMLGIAHTKISRELGLLRAEVMRLQREDDRFEELPNYEDVLAQSHVQERFDLTKDSDVKNFLDDKSAHGRGRDRGKKRRGSSGARKISGSRKGGKHAKLTGEEDTRDETDDRAALRAAVAELADDGNSKQESASLKDTVAEILNEADDEDSKRRSRSASHVRQDT